MGRKLSTDSQWVKDERDRENRVRLPIRLRKAGKEYTRRAGAIPKVTNSQHAAEKIISAALAHKKIKTCEDRLSGPARQAFDAVLAAAANVTIWGRCREPFFAQFPDATPISKSTWRDAYIRLKSPVKPCGKG